MIRVGTSGWSYADWEGIVYPREKPAGFHSLAHLARFVDCVEINSSFYAPSNPRHAERWVELTREHPEFRFTAKLLSDFTHGPAPQVGDENWATRAGLWCAGLAPLVKKARRLAGETDKTYVLTNNHFEGQALANALELSAALQGGAVLAPAELVARYPQLEASTRAVGQRELF